MRPSIQPTPPVVDCKQPATSPISAAPAADQWVDATPGVMGAGMARLSEKAAVWIIELLGTVKKERDYRKIEHECLDEHEKKGLIRQ